MSLRDDGRRGTRSPPFGLVFLPFLLGVAVTLLVVAGTGTRIDGGWVTVAIVAGTALAAFVFARTLRAGPAIGPLAAAVPAGAPPPRDLPSALLAPRPATGGEADPLANIHAVERQARRMSRECLNCGTSIAPDAEACPGCGHRFMVRCKGCQTHVRVDWAHCPECGRALS